MKKILAIGAVVLAVAVVCCTTAFAVDGGFSYLTGKSRSAARSELYANAEQLPEDERDEYLASYGIAEEPYSEEAAAGYSYVTGQQNGSQYENADEDDDGDYAYLQGQSRSAARNELYANAEQLPEDERDEYLASYGIAEEPYSEEAAAGYSYVTGQQNGSQYENADEDDDGDYAYLQGQSRSAARNELYANAEQLPEDERDEYLASYGIAEEPYSEEAAAGYSYVTGQQNGSRFEDDDEDKTGYSYLAGKERGASYQK